MKCLSPPSPPKIQECNITGCPQHHELELGKMIVNPICKSNQTVNEGEELDVSGTTGKLWTERFYLQLVKTQVIAQWFWLPNQNI